MAYGSFEKNLVLTPYHYPFMLATLQPIETFFYSSIVRSKDGDDGEVWQNSDSIAGQRAFTLAEILTAAYGVKSEISDLASAINTEFVPNLYFPIVSGRSKPFAIGM